MLRDKLLTLIMFFQKGAPDRWRLVRAHGTAVGLPTEDDMGNSEVGHNALGAGRIYAQGYNTQQCTMLLCKSNHVLFGLSFSMTNVLVMLTFESYIFR